MWAEPVAYGSRLAFATITGRAPTLAATAGQLSTASAPLIPDSPCALAWAGAETGQSI